MIREISLLFLLDMINPKMIWASLSNEHPEWFNIKLLQFLDFVVVYYRCFCFMHSSPNNPFYFVEVIPKDTISYSMKAEWNTWTIRKEISLSLF